jgi:hypothetical protein
MPESILDTAQASICPDPIRAIEIEFHFLKAYILASKPQDRSQRLRTTPTITPPLQCACKRSKRHWRAFYELVLGTFWLRKSLSR